VAKLLSAAEKIFEKYFLFLNYPLIQIIDFLSENTDCSIYTKPSVKKAPVLGGINNKHLKQLLWKVLVFLTHVFNNCQTLCYFPYSFQKLWQFQNSTRKIHFHQTTGQYIVWNISDIFNAFLFLLILISSYKLNFFWSDWNCSWSSTEVKFISQSVPYFYMHDASAHRGPESAMDADDIAIVSSNVVLTYVIRRVKLFKCFENIVWGPLKLL
jgi:hypothetical protein